LRPVLLLGSEPEPPGSEFEVQTELDSVSPMVAWAQRVGRVGPMVRLRLRLPYPELTMPSGHQRLSVLLEEERSVASSVVVGLARPVLVGIVASSVSAYPYQPVVAVVASVPLELAFASVPSAVASSAWSYSYQESVVVVAAAVA